MAETLAAGDLTTAFTKWLATKTSPKNEVIRAALNTNYATSKDDIARNLTRFLHDRA
jgi:hypothetical protein